MRQLLLSSSLTAPYLLSDNYRLSNPLLSLFPEISKYRPDEPLCLQYAYPSFVKSWETTPSNGSNGRTSVVDANSSLILEP